MPEDLVHASPAGNDQDQCTPLLRQWQVHWHATYCSNCSSKYWRVWNCTLSGVVPVVMSAQLVRVTKAETIAKLVYSTNAHDIPPARTKLALCRPSLAALRKHQASSLACPAHSLCPRASDCLRLLFLFVSTIDLCTSSFAISPQMLPSVERG